MQLIGARRAVGRLAAVFVAGALLASCGPDRPGIDLDFDERLGGDTTAFSAGSNAFELSARNLANEERRIFEVGDSFFTQNWVTAPASTEARDGMGPTFNALSCSSCHARDGRAKPPDDDEDPERGLLLRLSIAGPDGPVDEPVYGGQLQDRAIIGVAPEGRIGIRYEIISGAYPDGTPFTLRKPTYIILDPAFGPHDLAIMISPRIASAVIGMGLLEAIPAARILERADPDDADGDGISGRLNMVRDISSAGRLHWDGSGGRPTSPRWSSKPLARSRVTSGSPQRFSLRKTVRRHRRLARRRPTAARPRYRTNGWPRSCSTCRPWLSRPCATLTSRRCDGARSCSWRPAAPPAIRPGT